MFFTPLTQVVPLEVAAAALVIVGALMMAQIRDIDFDEFSVALPVFLTIIVMPLTYSIANGIGVGFISWVLIRSLSGRAREDQPAAVGRRRRLPDLLRPRADRGAARALATRHRKAPAPLRSRGFPRASELRAGLRGCDGRAPGNSHPSRKVVSGGSS